MKIYSWNVNGIRAAFKKGFPEWLSDCDGDIICLQETKISEDQIEESISEIGNYKSYFHSAQKKGYSGVAVYSKEEPLSVTKTIGEKEFDSEGRVLRLDFKKFILLNVYFPNGGASDERLDYKLRFYDYFLKYINKLRDDGKKVIICGDYNTAHKEIDLARPKANRDKSGFMEIECKWMDKLVEESYIDTFRLYNPDKKDEYSWWSYRANARSNNVGWRIDYFFVTPNLKRALEDAEIHQEITGSDHCPVSIDLSYQTAN
jgi:exodeoxyribonuclease-3